MVRAAALALALALAFWLAFTGTSHAQADPQAVNRGNYLHQQCNDPEPFALGFCMGTVSGFIHGFEMSSAAGAEQRFFCRPDNSTMGQGIDIVKRYLAANPDKRDAYASVLIILALHEAWPCPNGPKAWFDPEMRTLRWRDQK